jgi:glycosyltransferase involved in cell wall biosynthesis
MARQVMVGNRHLRDYAVQYNTEVTIIPTTIDTRRYRPELRTSRADGVPVIGWTGSYSTHQHLRRLFPALTRLAERHRFRLVVVGTEAPQIPGVEVEFRPWRSESEVQDLADLDIGVMPLPDDAWSRGKCGLKALQYMALAVPAIVSPVGVNTEIVEDGVNSIVAKTDEEWVEQLSRLIQDPLLRGRLGRAARRTVEERYSAEVFAPRVYDVFEKATLTCAARAREGRVQTRDVSQ